MSNIILEMRNISKNFGGVHAIEDFSMQLEQGSIYGLIGPNGAGKTTIFNMITGIYEADSGKIFYKGEDITNISPHEAALKGIARTFQNIRLFGNLSVKTNVIIACNMHSKYNMIDAVLRLPKYRTESRAVEEKAMQFLEIVGLTDKANDIADSLPYGHQRKLEIARAMASNPSLLLLDEPAAGMNVDESLELVEFIKRLRREFEITILMIEHHMDVVTNLCDKCSVLNFGKLIACGTVDDVKNNEAVVRAYLGEDY